MNYTLAKLYRPKNGNDWYVYYRFRDPVTEKMKLFKERKDLNRIKDKKLRRAEFEAMAAGINNNLKSGWSPLIVTAIQKQSQVPLLKLLNELYEIKKATLRAKTNQHYKYVIDMFTEYLEYSKVPEIKPAQLTSVLAFGFSDFLLSVKKHAAKTHNNHIGSIGGFFNMMVDREIIQKNPFKVVKKKPESSGKNIAYSDAQREKIKSHLEKTGHPLLMMVQFIYYCFIRPKELMELQVKHIDFHGKQIQIPGNVSKNRKQSSVEIPNTFFIQVKEKYQSLDPELYLFGRGLIPHPISVHRNRASAAHKKVLDELKISNDHTLYAWKHTGAVAAIKSGMNPYTLMRQLRHSSLDQTMIYLKTLGLTANSEFSMKMTEF